MNTTAKTIQRIYPSVRYKNARAAITWLTTVLGAREQQVCTGDDDTIHHAELALAGNLIMLGTGNEASGDNSTLYVALDTPAEIDDAYARAKAAGAEIVRDLCDTDYGSHDFSVRDPEGHRWSFGTYCPQAES